MTPRDPASIEVEEVSKRFGHGEGAVLALDRVSLTIAGNEFFTLLGPSGCGKTTLLRMIAGFEEPSAGTIRLAGQPLDHLPPFRRPVNTVFQSYALFPHLTVAENVAFGLEMQRRPKSEIEAEVRRALAMVRLEGLAGRYPRQLSGGQQQRVALARALANRPRVLLLDEPLSALDLKLRKEMQLELKRLRAETGITFIFVTHDQEEALTMSDRIAVMDHGRVLQVGTPAEIYDRPRTRFVADFIGETNLIEAVCTGAGEGGGTRFRLAGGEELAVPDTNGIAPGTKATLAIRPERIELVDPASAAALAATVEAVVYLGTDTVYRARLADGTPVQARIQNRSGPTLDLAPGDPLGVRLVPEAVRVVAE
ncbi:ABC transporter ATP-binding protein [Benzoatithermus flavus]|uniref:Spermidine/putrescine import ATP-binding protein PotA n=1 Tax=Benzoatithermus flavus TaxID=3108223 RepID=A0ABU8XQN2_9PROT